MRAADETLEETIAGYILAEFLPGEEPENLTRSTPLISTGILDSIARLRLVAFLEDAYGIAVAPAEVNIDHFETLGAIAELVRAKRSAKKAE